MAYKICSYFGLVAWSLYSILEFGFIDQAFDLVAELLETWISDATLER